MTAASDLPEIAKRLSQLLKDLPDDPAVVDTCDYIAGALYSLFKCEQFRFWNRQGPV